LESAKHILYGMSLDELRELCAEMSMQRFAAAQTARWLYRRFVDSFDRMTDLSAASLALLAERCSTGLRAPERVSVSADGTRKYLYRTLEGAYVESAYIPDGDRATLCVSSQAGCRMGCRFCATWRQGLQHSLAAPDILNQIVSLPERDTLTNIVYMGMGEPLDNIEEVLRSLDPSSFDFCFVCISENFQSSLETTSLLKEMGAPMVVAKADRDLHARLLLKIGADEVVFPEREGPERRMM